MPKPAIKYVGGKTQLLPILRDVIPSTDGRYWEPFVGGGSVVLDLMNDKFQRGTISDVNRNLISLYKILQEDPKLLMSILDAYGTAKEFNTAERFYKERDLYNDKIRPDYEQAARLVYLNRTCFNGLHRVNRKGEFNVPFGKYSNPRLYDRINVLAIADVMQYCEILHSGYEHVLESAASGDVVYFDPPYAKVSETSSFSGYSGEFGPKQQKELSECFRKLVDRGVRCVLSNSDVPLIHELYAGFDIRVIQARRSINSKGDKRGSVNEVLVVA